MPPDSVDMTQVGVSGHTNVLNVIVDEDNVILDEDGDDEPPEPVYNC